MNAQIAAAQIGAQRFLDLVRRYGRDTVGAGKIGLASVPFGATMVIGRVMGRFANGRLTNIAAIVATGWCCCSM